VRVGLLSDSHVPDAVKELPMPEVRKAFEGVELILHAGDIYFTTVLDDLATIAPVLAALGDDDSVATMERDRRIKSKHSLALEGHKLLLVHQRPYGLGQPTFSPGEKAEDLPDVVVFGHEHRTTVERSHGIIFVNPGSPTFLNYQRGLGTVGILDVRDGQMDVKIVHL
jgi:putative phosphoesterase